MRPCPTLLADSRSRIGLVRPRTLPQGVMLVAQEGLALEAADGQDPGDLHHRRTAAEPCLWKFMAVCLAQLRLKLRPHDDERSSR